jgi:hypothetical protein
MQSSFGFPPVPRIRSAVSPKNEQGVSGSAHKSGSSSTTEKEHNSTEWTDIPIAERFELLATIREVREWRFGADPPLFRLAPIRQAALDLHRWLNRHADVR